MGDLQLHGRQIYAAAAPDAFRELDIADHGPLLQKAAAQCQGHARRNSPDQRLHVHRTVPDHRAVALAQEYAVCLAHIFSLAGGVFRQYGGPCRLRADVRPVYEVLPDRGRDRCAGTRGPAYRCRSGPYQGAFDYGGGVVSSAECGIKIVKGLNKERQMETLGTFKDVESAIRAVDSLIEAGFSEETIASLTSVPYPDGVIVKTSRRTWFRWVSAAGGIIGAVAGFALAAGTAYMYPVQTGDKPIVAYFPTGIITYEITMLFAILGAIGGMFLEMKLPPWREHVYDPAIGE